MNKRLRITIVLGPFTPTPPASTGAIEQLWLQLAEQFADFGHEVTLLSRQHSAMSNQEHRNGVYHRRCPGFDRRRTIAIDLVNDLRYSLAIRHQIADADIVLTNVFWLPVLLTWQSLNRRFKINVHIQRFPKRQMFLYKRAHRISTVSSAVADAIIDQTPSISSIVKVIPNPINTRVFVPADKAKARNDSAKTIAYSGRVHPEKGLHLLVEAFRRLHALHPELRLRIIGPYEIQQGGGGKRFVDHLKCRADGRPVEFVEPILDQSELASELQAADYYCYPSVAERGESFGVAPLEAMATGVPTVVSALKCFEDFMTDGETGLVFDHRDSEPAVRLSEQLKALIDHPQWAQQLADRGSARARTFSVETIALAYLNDFHEMAASDTEPASKAIGHGF